MIKKIFLMALVSIVIVSCADDKILSQNDAPQEVQSSISLHFPEKKVVQITADTEGIRGKKYNVIFEDNTQAEYSVNGELQEAKSATQLPDAIVPQGILTYIKSNYQNNFITEINLEDKNSKDVKLNSGLELEFDVNYNFLRIED